MSKLSKFFVLSLVLSSLIGVQGVKSEEKPFKNRKMKKICKYNKLNDRLEIDCYGKDLEEKFLVRAAQKHCSSKQMGYSIHEISREAYNARENLKMRHFDHFEFSCI